MGRRLSLSQDDINWLTDNHERLSLRALASEFSCCVDTIKRILMRHELRHFEGAKYQFKIPEKTWGRACIKCGCEKPRPKFQYKCIQCTTRDSLCRVRNDEPKPISLANLEGIV